MKWRDGRQDAKYDVLDFFRISFPWGGGADSCVIRYVAPVDLPAHTDEVDGHKHFRLNIVFGSKGEFEAETIFNLLGRVILFRPDKSKHSMKLRDGRRYVLSFGVAI